MFLWFVQSYYLTQREVYLQQYVCVCKCLCECEIVCGPTDHAVNGAKEHGALGGRGALAQVLQHQRTVAEDIDKLTEVEDPHLLQVLPLLVCSGRTDRRKNGGRERRDYKHCGMEHVRCKRVETGANRKRRDQIKEYKHKKRQSRKCLRAQAID